MKIKVDKYYIFNKGKWHDILVFPKVKYMWAFDDYPSEDLLMVDGDKEALELLKQACAILASDPSKIIYFPIKNEGIKSYYRKNYHLVLVRPELQFKRSEWYDLKSRINKKSWQGKYVYHYNEQKINDYNEKMEHSWRRWKLEKASDKLCKQEVLGDTIFWVMPQINCYQCHVSLSETLNWDCGGRSSDSYYWGWLLSDNIIEEMEEEDGGRRWR